MTQTMLGRRRRKARATPGHGPRPVRRPPRRGEEGFTLIELLIVIVILPLVMGAITMVLITTLKNEQGIQGKVTDSAASATASTFFVRDVQSAASVSTAASPTSAPPQCSASGVAGTPQLLVGLQLQGVSTVVSYYTLTPSRAAPMLARFLCTGGSSTPQSYEILSDNLSTADLPSVALSCVTPTPTSIPQNVTCAPGTDWTPTYLLSPVSLNVTQGCTGAGSCAPYQYTMTGNPQTGIPVPPIAQACGVLTLLGTGTDITFAPGASQAIQANGPIVLDSGYNTGSTPAVYGDFTFSDQVTAGASTACASIPATDSLQIYNCLDTASSGASANFQPCPTSGQHSVVSTSFGSPISLSPSPVQTVAAPTDPKSAWAQQNAGAANIAVSGNGSCTTVGTTMRCSPGLYSNGLNITDGRTVNFSAGNYQFNNNGSCGSSLCVGNGDTVNFGTGHYIYANGIEVAGSGSALCGGGVASSSCPGMPMGGVFFYVKNGTTDLGNFNFGNVVDLGAIPATPTSSDPYAGVLLWQDGTDSNSVTFTTSLTATTNTLNGEIYTPNATIDLGGGGVGQTVINTGDIVANSINFSASYQLQLNVG